MTRGTPTSEWLIPPEALALRHDEVHVWRVMPSLSSAHLEELQKSLSPDEQERARRFHSKKGHDEFVLARVSLRDILCRYLGKGRDDLRFCTGRHGKPALALDPGEPALRFNLSHSNGLVLHAVACGREVGIDVERVDTGLVVEPLARRFFSSRENAMLHALPADRQREAFFACWTRKEAFIKAIGEGISHPLDQFDVSVSPYEPAVLIETRPDPQEAECWLLKELIAGLGYMAAVAVQGRNWRLKCWQWPGIGNGEESIGNRE